MPLIPKALETRSTSAGRLNGHGRHGLNGPGPGLGGPGGGVGRTSTPLTPLSSLKAGRTGLQRAKSADRTYPDRRTYTPPASAPSSAPSTARCKVQKEKEKVVLKDLQRLEEKLATAERERDWAMTALRQSESELQKLLAQRSSGDAESDVRLNHYRVLLELLNLRCRLLEQWIEEEATLMAAQEERHAAALKRMEQQVQELASEVVEQQVAFQEQVAAMSAQQEKLEQQHCEDYSLWSEELLRGREKASQEVAALQQEMKRQESLWQQEWVKMQQEASRHGIDVPEPPGFLLQWLAEQEKEEPREERGRAALLETIPEAADLEEEGQTPSALEPSEPRASETASPTRSSPVCVSESNFKGREAGESQGSSQSSSSRTSRNALCTAVPEDLLKNLDRASDDHQASRAWARIGQCHQRQKSFEKARQAYQHAVSLDASQHGCLANLAQLEAHAGNVDRAKEMLAAALQLDPSNKNYISFRQWLAKT